MKLLIAEDDLTSRTMLAVIVQNWGFEPIMVEDGEAAWQVMQGAEPPRLLLIDWEMPQLDGLALCQRVRLEKSDDPPYIILLTARSKTADIVEGLSKGANDYIAKPFENAELQARLQVGRRMLDLQAQLNKSKETLTFQATYDALTGLLNRGAVMKVLEQNMAYVQRQPEAALFICLCDIDHFKRINDTHGHLAGDAILQGVARRIATALRPYDQVGRYGGEEFLILQYTFRDQVYNPFERIRRATADTPFIVEEISLAVTISCGVTLFAPPEDIRNATALLAAADAALYEAKVAGRNRTVLDASASGIGGDA